MAHTPIRLALVTPEQHMPTLQTSDHLFPSTLELLRMSILQLTLGQWLPLPRLLHLNLAFLWCQADLFLWVNGNEHLLYAA